MQPCKESINLTNCALIAKYPDNTAVFLASHDKYLIAYDYDESTGDFCTLWQTPYLSCALDAADPEVQC